MKFSFLIEKRTFGGLKILENIEASIKIEVIRQEHQRWNL
jgi:hypothetical protein